MTHHGAGLRKLKVKETLIEHLKRDYRQAPVSSPDMAMLDYSAKLTRTPWEMSQTDVETLRRENFSDAAILDICQIAGYYNFVNRLADGLGVELEPYWTLKTD